MNDKEPVIPIVIHDKPSFAAFRPLLLVLAGTILVGGAVVAYQALAASFDFSGLRIAATKKTSLQSDESIGRISESTVLKSTEAEADVSMDNVAVEDSDSQPSVAHRPTQESGNRLANNMNQGIVAESDQGIFMTMEMKSNGEGTILRQVGEDGWFVDNRPGFNLQYDGQYLYYSSGDTNKGIYRVADFSNPKAEQIADVSVDQLVYYQETLYVTDEQGVIMTLDPDGSNVQSSSVQNASHINPYENTLYFIENQGETGQIMRVTLNDPSGSWKPERVGEISASALCIDQGKLYFINPTDNDFLYSADLDGTNVALVLDQPVETFIVADEAIYYISKTDHGAYGRRFSDGYDSVFIQEDPCKSLAITEEFLFVLYEEAGDLKITWFTR